MIRSLTTAERAELTQLAQQLVQTPSVNEQHAERPAAELVAAAAQRFGLAAELVGKEPARPNVVVRVGPAGEPALLLIAHTDTVAVGDAAAWTYPPFGGVIDAGRLYGRGAADTKGGLVAALGALVLLGGLPPEALPQPVLLVGVPDEEAGATGRLGIDWLHQAGLLGGRGAIYAYPGLDRIGVGHRGVLRLRLTAQGTAFHTGTRSWQDAGHGHNALSGLAEALVALESLTFPTPAPDDPLFAPYRSVLTPTTLTGGSGPSSVPATATATVDIRLTLGLSPEEALQLVRERIAEVVARRPPLRIAVQEDVFIPPTRIPDDTPVVTALKAAASEVRGVAPTLAVTGPANESYLLNRLGIPTCTYGPAGGNVHAADEYLVVASLFEAANIYARAALKLAQPTRPPM